MGCAGNCNGRNCCGGCSHKPFDSRISPGLRQSVQQLCCSCVPLGICVSITDESGYAVDSAFLWRHCTVTPDGEDYILYSGLFAINGENVTLYFRFKPNEAAQTCAFCVDGAGISQTCVQIDHSVQHVDPYCEDPCSQKTEFCCGFAATFTVDSSGVGDATHAEVTISVSKLDLISLSGYPGTCGNCDCICRCACFSVTSIDSSSSETVCATVSTVEVPSGCDAVKHTSVSWEHSSGYVITLDGLSQPLAIAATVLSGTETGTYERVNCPDELLHIIAADAGDIEIEYRIDNGADAPPAETVRWFGYLTGSSDATVYAYNWVALAWDVIGVIEPRSVTTQTSEHWTLEVNHTGTTGADDGIVKLKFVAGQYATDLATDWLDVYRPSCCKFGLTVPDGVYLDGSPISDIDITVGNECPSPIASWDLFDANGDPVFIRWQCSLCDFCSDVTSSCCDRPLPNVLTATFVMSNCTGCSSAQVFLVYDEIDQTWRGVGEWCGEQLTVSLSCAGYPGSATWTLIAETARACFLGAESGVTHDSATCTPFEILFSGTLFGIDCCPTDPFAVVSVSVIVTE